MTTLPFVADACECAPAKNAPPVESTASTRPNRLLIPLLIVAFVLMDLVILRLTDHLPPPPNTSWTTSQLLGAPQQRAPNAFMRGVTSVEFIVGVAIAQVGMLAVWLVFSRWLVVFRVCGLLVGCTAVSTGLRQIWPGDWDTWLMVLAASVATPAFAIRCVHGHFRRLTTTCPKTTLQFGLHNIVEWTIAVSVLCAVLRGQGPLAFEPSRLAWPFEAWALAAVPCLLGLVVILPPPKARFGFLLALTVLLFMTFGTNGAALTTLCVSLFGWSVVRVAGIRIGEPAVA